MIMEITMLTIPLPVLPQIETEKEIHIKATKTRGEISFKCFCSELFDCIWIKLINLRMVMHMMEVSFN